MSSLPMASIYSTHQNQASENSNSIYHRCRLRLKWPYQSVPGYQDFICFSLTLIVVLSRLRGGYQTSNHSSPSLSLPIFWVSLIATSSSFVPTFAQYSTTSFELTSTSNGTLKPSLPPEGSHLVRPLLKVAPGSDQIQVQLDWPFEFSSNHAPLILDLEGLEWPDMASFVSPNFVFAVQEEESNHDFHQTVEHRYRNHSQYYSTRVAQALGQVTHDEEVSNRCQLFTGNLTTRGWPSHTRSTASLALCTDGNLNGIATWYPHGYLLVESVDQQQPCNLQPQPKDQVQDLKVFQSCNHRVRFVAATISEKLRVKRSNSLERTIEMFIVTDLSMSLYHGNLLRNYIFALMATVSHLFEHSTIGNEINIKLLKLTTLTDEKQEENWFGSAHTTLRYFCQWQHVHNYPGDEHPLHHDTAILLTRVDLCRSRADMLHYINEISASKRKSAKASCETIGLAQFGQICDPESSCAIVEDNGLSTAFTIAHELGHLLGIPHDDEEHCKNFYAQNGAQSNAEQRKDNIMVRMFDYASDVWSWSPCSKHFITEFLDSNRGDCLLDDNTVDVRDTVVSRFAQSPYQRRSSQSHWVERLSKYPAGVLYSADQQCKLMFGGNTSVCLDMPKCSRLWCTTEAGSCRTQHMPWADGTECGSARWCQQGECVRVDPKTKQPVDGGWSEWSNWSQCSLPCGGGVRRSRRQCNKPEPKNGGKFCLGERIRYQSCNIEPCSTSGEDSRAKQCSEFDGHKITGMPYNVTWVPHYNGVPESDMCALHCADSKSGESHKLKPMVLDGTSCTPDSFDICVNGKCLSAGCDRILGSTVRTDSCGVCGGDNSTCREISGQVAPPTLNHGYTWVLTIPPGATNVLITKERNPNQLHFDDNSWLAMKGEDDNYLLNGAFTVNVYERKWFYGGGTIEYSGIKQHGLERINSSRPINKALHIEILCVGELHVPVLNYRYVVISNNVNLKYRWYMNKDWTECSKVCNGEQEMKPYCMAIMRKLFPRGDGTKWPLVREVKVRDDYCNSQTRPPTEYRVCNTNCELEWYVQNLTQCSAKCGPGTRTRQVNCTQSLMESRGKRLYIDDSYCQHLGNKPTESEPCNGTECRLSFQWRYGQWSSCSVQHTCGSGQQSRQVQCLLMTHLEGPHSSGLLESIQHHEECLKHLPEPLISQRCHVECPRWNMGDWSECSNHCGDQIRSVTCLHGSQPVNDAYCASLEPKPTDRISCQMTECRQVNQIALRKLEQSISADMNSNSINQFSQISSISINLQSQYAERYNQSFPGMWSSGEWSSCNDTYERINSIQHQLKRHFYLPECFNSSEEVALFRNQFALLFKLNETLSHKSYADLSSILNLDQSSLFHRRYVACILVQTQQIVADSECDPAIRPNSTGMCPLLDSAFQAMPHFNVEYCHASTSATGTEPVPSESEQHKMAPSASSASALLDTFEWEAGQWGPCLCEVNRFEVLRKRLVRCIRRLLYSAQPDWRVIQDEYCRHLTKPAESEQCSDRVIECRHSTTEHPSVLSQSIQPSLLESPSLLSTTSSTLVYHLSSPSLPVQPPLPTTALRPTVVTIDHQATPTTYLPNIISSLSDETYSTIYNEPMTIQPSTTFSEVSESSVTSGGDWTWSEWSECSVSCGSGTQRRDPMCTAGQSCDEHQRPSPQMQRCDRICVFFTWHYSPWSNCTGPRGCGPGTRTRRVHCRDWTGNTVPDAFCERNKLEPLIESCQMTECKMVWRAGTWSECSQSCGIGVQKRRVTCHRVNSHNVTDPRAVPNPNKLIRRRRNGRHTRHWYSHKDGTRHKRQQVTQVKHRSTLWCDPKSRPSEQRSCNLGYCLQSNMADAYAWRTHPWQSCSTPCGPGKQYRKISCSSQRTNLRVSRFHCHARLRPEKWQECHLRDCNVISCKDLRDRGPIRHDGEYELWVQGAKVRVYCFGMSTLNEPVEYLILNVAHYDDNYSQLVTSTCTSNDYNQVSVLGGSHKSVLYFKYVRFNPLTLEIFANDTRYTLLQQDALTNQSVLIRQAERTTFKHLSLGFGYAILQGCLLKSSKDYSASNSITCHFGTEPTTDAMFSINLHKTGLAVADDQWALIASTNSYSNRKHIQISRNGEKIIGYCGTSSSQVPVRSLSSACQVGCRPVDEIIRLKVP